MKARVVGLMHLSYTLQDHGYADSYGPELDAAVKLMSSTPHEGAIRL
jgi:hypothetical protein